MSARRAATSALSALLIAPLMALAPVTPSEATVGGQFVTTWDTSSRQRIGLHL